MSFFASSSPSSGTMRGYTSVPSCRRRAAGSMAATIRVADRNGHPRGRCWGSLRWRWWWRRWRECSPQPCVCFDVHCLLAAFPWNA